MELTSTYLRTYLPMIQDDRLRSDILAHGLLRSFPAGQTLLMHQQYIDYIPLVTSGGVKVVRSTEDHKSLFLYFLQAGETCTMTLSSCIKRETSRVRAKTITETEAVLLPVERVYFYTRHFPSWNEFTLHAFRLKFDAILQAFEGLAFAPLEDRVIDYLQAIAQISNNPFLHITHEAIANDLGASRVGISRILKRLEQHQQLRLTRGEIEVL